MRKARQKLVLYLFTLIILVSIATDAPARCTVAHPGPPCQEYWRADAVFIGVVTRVVHTSNTTGLAIGPYLPTAVYFSIEETLKGVTGTEIVFDLDHCGFQFMKNERYLVYAHLNRNSNKLEVREGNTRTQPLSRAASDLTYIRGLRSKPSSTVYGTVTQYTYNVQEKYFDAEPLQNITSFWKETINARKLSPIAKAGTSLKAYKRALIEFAQTSPLISPMRSKH